VNIEASIIKIILKQEAPFFYKAEIFIKAEIGKRIIDEQ